MARTPVESSGCWKSFGFAIAGGAIGGFIGFWGGFFGPLVFSHARQGPLLGFFITGPLGVLFGALVGALWAQFYPRRKK